MSFLEELGKVFGKVPDTTKEALELIAQSDDKVGVKARVIEVLG